MLRRVAAIGLTASEAARLNSTPSGKNVEFLSIEPGSPLPPATMAVLATKDGYEAGFNAAVDLADQHVEILKLLSLAIDVREEFLPGASRRIQKFAAHFAEALGLSSDERLTLERGVLMRDIGKLQIPNYILLKDSLLNHEEWSMLQRHTHIGAELIRNISALQDTEPVVRHHHECWDGSGYPEGLEGEKIPILAQVAKVVDVYCAMTSARHYRQGKSTREEALAYVAEYKGQMFNPELAEKFIASNIAETAEE